MNDKIELKLRRHISELEKKRDELWSEKMDLMLENQRMQERLTSCQPDSMNREVFYKLLDAFVEVMKLESDK